MKRISDEARIIAYFLDRPIEETASMLRVVNAIVARKGGNAAPKVGRPRVPKNKGLEQPTLERANG